MFDFPGFLIHPHFPFRCELSVSLFGALQAGKRGKAGNRAAPCCLTFWHRSAALWARGKERENIPVLAQMT
jgi:hypothetical protein